MKYLHIFRPFLVLNFFILSTGSGVGPAYAEDPRFLSAYHSEYGLKLFNDENYDLATERFAKAFLLDPNNQIAKETLQKIAAEKARLGSSGLKILRFIDQVEYIDFLTARYQGLTEENSRLLEFLRNNKNLSGDAALQEKFHTVEKQIAEKPSALPRVGLIGFAGEESQTLNLDNLISQLVQERANLAKEVGFWEEQNNQLRHFRKTVLSQSSSINPLAEAGKVKSQLEEVNQRVVEKDQLLTVQQDNIDYFKNELTRVRDDFTALQENFRATDIKIVELTNKIAALSVEIFEKNKMIGEKDERAANLQNDLNMANEKFNLVQRIIKEKDDRIAALETEMGQLHNNLASGQPSGFQVTQLQGDLKDFEAEFKDQISKSRERLASLESQYTDLINLAQTAY